MVFLIRNTKMVLFPRCSYYVQSTFSQKITSLFYREQIVLHHLHRTYISLFLYQQIFFHHDFLHYLLDNKKGFAFQQDIYSVMAIFVLIFDKYLTSYSGYDIYAIREMYFSYFCLKFSEALMSVFSDIFRTFDAIFANEFRNIFFELST